MMENEEIKKVINGLNFLKEKLYNGIYADRLDCIDYAISALKEIQQYREIGSVEECKELASMFTTEKKNVLGQIVDEWNEYIEIGTMEECREAVEKQKAKKCIIDSCPDHTHYKCPSCGKIHLSKYKCWCQSLGRIPRYCEYCGQAIDENLEVTHDGTRK